MYLSVIKEPVSVRLSVCLYTFPPPIFQVRPLQLLFAEALTEGAKHVVTGGGPQSGHCRSVSLICRSLGLKPHIVIEGVDRVCIVIFSYIPVSVQLACRHPLVLHTNLNKRVNGAVVNTLDCDSRGWRFNHASDHNLKVVQIGL